MHACACTYTQTKTDSSAESSRWSLSHRSSSSVKSHHIKFIFDAVSRCTAASLSPKKVIFSSALSGNICTDCKVNLKKECVILRSYVKHHTHLNVPPRHRQQVICFRHFGPRSFVPTQSQNCNPVESKRRKRRQMKRIFSVLRRTKRNPL